MRIGLASDHAGYEYKQQLIAYLRRIGISVVDYGTHGTASVDYPDFAHAVAEGVLNNADSLGILICGTGNGMAITANKHAGIRAALCWAPEIAALAKQHNNANIVVLPARFISTENALLTLQAYFDTEFEGGRHQRRIDKINL